MNEALLTLLQAVITAAVPVLTVYLCKFLSTKKKEAITMTENETAKMLIDGAMSAVEKAVAVTNQTYVDVLKRQGTFSIENQKEAFQKSYDTAVALMTQEAADYIEKVYGSVANWLTAQIEAQVREQKILS